jgi:hypothetical protein
MIAVVALFIECRISVTIAAAGTRFDLGVASVEDVDSPITAWGERRRTAIAALAVVSGDSRLIRLWARSRERRVASCVAGTRHWFETWKIAHLTGMTGRDEPPHHREPVTAQARNP